MVIFIAMNLLLVSSICLQYVGPLKCEQESETHLLSFDELVLTSRVHGELFVVVVKVIM